MESSVQPRILALDVGDRRIGIALSDALGCTAQPLLTLHRTSLRADVKSVARLVRKHEVAEIVVGNPLYMSGDQSPQAAKAQAFAEQLAEAIAPVPIRLWDERLTTTEAHRHLDAAGVPGGQQGRAERKQIIDQVAAVLILQGFLDARR
ncbi:MAG: Holliday junction resolvase RuvX [Acidobacteriaceae bacterium]|nr:Holliday junction resolvase RuvX [Acidobacteriaceae bacterium]